MSTNELPSMQPPTSCQPARVMDPVDFHGQALTVVGKDDEPYVAMKPIVEGMGLDWKSQYRKLTDEESRFCMVIMTIQIPGDDQTREVTMIPLRKLTGWLMTLQPSRMDHEVAAKVLVYQNECDDALWDYWSKGFAVNPRAKIPEDPTQLGLPDFNDPIAAAEGWLSEAKGRRKAELAAREAQTRVHLLTAKADEDAPLVDFAERVQAAPTTHLVGAVAKMIQQGTGMSMGQNRMFEWLRENKYLHQTGTRINQPTQRSLDAGWFSLQVRTVTVKDEPSVRYTTRVTGKGLKHLYEQFYRAAVEAGRKPSQYPELVSSTDVLKQLPLWENDEQESALATRSDSSSEIKKIR